ncbi:MAG: hypothetical protein RI953_1066 [Pseudomonadota bacterium]|jgi:hypothetical protein
MTPLVFANNSSRPAVVGRWRKLFCVMLLCVVVNLIASNAKAQNNNNGSAADLGDIPPVGWPLGAPLTCRAMTDSLNRTLMDAALKLRDYCNEQNSKMRAAGFKTCAVDECVDSLITRDNGYDHGKFVLRVYRSLYTGEPMLTLTYSYPGNVQSNGTFPVCFDPVSKSRELLDDEFANWDFNRFIEFCAAADVRK